MAYNPRNGSLMNKFDRVFSILILLQTRSILTAKDIAERFEISVRTVYRDINTLKSAGVPIIGDPGIGYSIMEGYRLPPMMFSEEEASALLTAEKFIGKLTDSKTQSNYRNAMIKIKSILRNSEKQSLAKLDDAIAISDDNNWSDQTYLQDMFGSIASKKIMKIEYRKIDGATTQRKVEAIGCYHQYNAWYLIAFCLARKDYRTFKVNRIVDLRVLDQVFNTEHISLQEYIDRQDASWKEDKRFHTIEIVFKFSLLEYAEKRKYYFGFIDQIVREDEVQMKFLNTSLDFVARWLLQFGDQATVLAPVELIDLMQSLTERLYKHYH